MPLYCVRALVELPPENNLGSMEDALWNEDGTIVYFNMPMLAPGSVDGNLNATLYMAVTQFDPATGERLEKWETREEVTLPVAPLLEEKSYLPQEVVTFDGLTLESVRGEAVRDRCVPLRHLLRPQGDDQGRGDGRAAYPGHLRRGRRAAADGVEPVHLARRGGAARGGRWRYPPRWSAPRRGDGRGRRDDRASEVTCLCRAAGLPAF